MNGKGADVRIAFIEDGEIQLGTVEGVDSAQMAGMLENIDENDQTFEVAPEIGDRMTLTLAQVQCTLPQGITTELLEEKSPEMVLNMAKGLLM